jgi:predicted NAD/FAD-dependent oxidoreductase
MGLIRVAIIGGGVGGTTVARGLVARNEGNPKVSLQVTIFEKSRGLGGRLSTRHQSGFQFDHGAPHFTIKDPVFAAFCEQLQAEGVLSEWTGTEAQLGEGAFGHFVPPPRWVAVPGMNALCKAGLEDGSDVRVMPGVEVAPLRSSSDRRWHLSSVAGEALGDFDVVVLTAPVPQSIKLIGAVVPPLSESAANMRVQQSLQNLELQPCFSLMIGLPDPTSLTLKRLGWCRAKVNDRVVSWIGVDSSKPGRDHSRTSIVVHSQALWSRERLEHPVEETGLMMLGALNRITNLDVVSPACSATHRWRYAARASGQCLDPAVQGLRLADQERGLYVVSEVFEPTRVEHAWLAADRVAGGIFDTF